MKIMKNHADLLHKIEIIKGQIEQYELSLVYWSGSTSVPMLNAVGSDKFGLSTASDRINKVINALQAMLGAFNMIRKQNEENINRLRGLKYRIEKLRFIEGMSYKEIAEELNYNYNYNYNYIRRVASKLQREEDEEWIEDNSDYREEVTAG